MLPTYDYLVVEYAGMPDMPAYMEGVRHKEKVYRANSIAAIFLYPQDLSGPDWPEGLVQRIEQRSRAKTVEQSPPAYLGMQERPGYS